MFHSEGGSEQEFLEDSNVYVDLGEYSLEELRITLDDII